jgi:hypothetical protein
MTSNDGEAMVVSLLAIGLTNNWKQRERELPPIREFLLPIR